MDGGARAARMSCGALHAGRCSTQCGRMHRASAIALGEARTYSCTGANTSAVADIVVRVIIAVIARLTLNLRSL